jgi:hypothetical protein
MFKKIFSKISGDSIPLKSEEQLDPGTAALIRTVREKSKEDPLLGAKLGSREVFQRLLNGMKNEKGVHVESLLCALGSLAGYACQANLRAQAQAKGLQETAAFQIVTTTDGRQYFFGDPLNNALAGSQYSVWGLAGGAAQHAGAKEFPDVNELFQHAASTVGGDQFGVPRIPENHRAGDRPINYLKALWPVLQPTVKLFCPTPVDWPILYGLAIQEAMDTAKTVIDPALAFRIVMESAIPMSKVDLASA